MYSLNDIDALFDIADLLQEGNNIADIKEIYAKRDAKKAKTLSIGEVHHALEREFSQQGRFGTPNPTHFTQPRM